MAKCAKDDEGDQVEAAKEDDEDGEDALVGSQPHTTSVVRGDSPVLTRASSRASSYTSRLTSPRRGSQRSSDRDFKGMECLVSLLVLQMRKEGMDGACTLENIRPYLLGV